jgi:hypothetical protein
VWNLPDAINIRKVMDLLILTILWPIENLVNSGLIPWGSINLRVLNKLDDMLEPPKALSTLNLLLLKLKS